LSGTRAADLDLHAARRRLLVDTAGIAVSAVGFGFVFGLAARDAGYSTVEAAAMSVFAFSGAAQFAAVGYVSAGLGWLPNCARIRTHCAPS
jgi:predicted branched-subunit amino acid permease